MPQINKQPTRKKSAKRKRKVGSVLDRIGDMGFDTGDGIKINLYGKSGTGKTTLWATFPDPILAIICSGSIKPGELRSIDTPDNRKRIQTVTIESAGEIQEIVADQKERGKYATVVLDHATGLQDMTLREVLGIEELPPQSSWGIATQQNWGTCALRMKERLRELLGLDCNVVIVAQEREFNTDGESELLMPFVSSALSPSVVGWLNPACDYICQTFIRQSTVERTVKIKGKTVNRLVKGKGVDYCLRTAPDPVFTTKFRIPKGSDLPDVIVDASYDKIMQLIRRE